MSNDLIIVVQGGVIQDVMSSTPCTVTIYDLDVDPDAVIDIPEEYIQIV